MSSDSDDDETTEEEIDEDEEEAMMAEEEIDMVLDDVGEWNQFSSNTTDSSIGSKNVGSPGLTIGKKQSGHRKSSVSGKTWFQKEVSYNKLLPYYDKLSTEADEQLAAIKAGLGRSVLLREVRPALLHWACELDKYIYLNGYRFSKEDHLKFVHLFYQMTVTPDLELRLVKTFAHVLLVLLRKKELLSREDLTLDWRPLYKLYEFVSFKNLEEDGLFLIPKDIVSGLELLIRQARTYFSVESTQEILDFVRPLMCPWDMTFSRACQVLSLFVPTNLPPSDYGKGHELWFDEVIHWWLLLQNGPPWEDKMVHLLTRLALHNIGHVDWNPYVPHIFTKLLRSFGLSVSGRATEKIEIGTNGNAFDTQIVAIWLASMLGGTSTVPIYLRRLFNSVESYLHPSNSGKWQQKILHFMNRLALSVCQRVHRERHRKPDWQTPVPDDWKLTDEQIEEFVNSMLPCALNGMFSKIRSELAVGSLRCLSHLCPTLVVPAVLEKLYPALDALTEPHRLTQSMNSLVGVILPLIRETSTRHHVIPLMNSILPGLDPNDAGKSMVTLQSLSLFSILVPMVDCSEAVHLRDDLTQEEKELCSATAMFEDYINLFMDRVFSIVETFASAAHSGTHRSKGAAAKLGLEENLLKAGMYSAYRALLSNCSTELYKVAVNRLFNYLEESSLEGRVTADMIGELCFSAVRTNAQYSFPLFFDMVSKRLKSAITEETFEEEEVEENIVWHLVILGQLVRCEGDALVEHRSKVAETLRMVSRLRAKEAYEIVTTVMENIFISLSFLYTCEHEKDRRVMDQPLDQYLPIRHWAESYDRHLLNLKWHTPSLDEIEFIRELLQLSVSDQLTALGQPEMMKKEAILRSLSFIKAGVAGAGSVLPLIDAEKYVQVVESTVEFSRFHYVADPNETAIDWNGQNVRQTVYEALHKLMEYLLLQREDETRALLYIIAIFNLLMFHRGLYKSKFDSQSRGLNMSKAIIGDKVLGKKANIKPLVAELVLIQHHKRLLEKSGYSITEVHLCFMKDLLKLATSAYSEVRTHAQQALDHCFSCFPYSYRLLLDDILPLLREDSNVTHEQFKGALYVLLGHKSRSLMTRHHWETVNKVWPSVIKAQHSEKPSIIALLDSIQATVIENIESFQILLKLSDSLLLAAKELWTGNGKAVPALPMPSEQEVKEAVISEDQRSQKNMQFYFETIENLVQLSNDVSLHWRHLDMAQSFLSLMLRMDTRFPPDAIQVFVRLLTHDSIKTRKMAIGFMAAALKIHRKSAKKMKLAANELMEKVSGTKMSVETKTHWPVDWGIRQDNEWLTYRKQHLPTSSQAWENTVFMEKTHHGFYCWPEIISHHAPSNEQPSVDRRREDLSSDEIPIFEAFTNEGFVEKFCQLTSLEEKKEEDHFHTHNYLLFKGLFRAYGDTFLAKFQPVVEKLVASTKAGEHRLAAELVAGLISGAKLWPFEKHVNMWKWLRPVLESALDNLTSETYRDWGTCVATVFDSRDPRKLHWFIDILLGLAKKPMDGSFSTASRYFLLQGGVNQQEWRVLEVWHDLYSIMEPHLAQPYQNLRDRLGSCLSTVFWFDLPGMTVRDSIVPPPKRAAFLEEINKKLQILWAEVEKGVPDEVSSGVDLMHKSPERKNAILLLKTILCYFNTHWSHSYVSLPNELIQFLPLLCYFENETTDEELKRDCHWQFLNGMARALTTPAQAPLLFDAIVKASNNKWWKARVSALQFLRVSLFSNLFYFWTDEFKGRIFDLLAGLLQDPQLEVREVASDTLSGLLHCKFIEIDISLMGKFKEWSSTTIAVTRHAGVLGLAAVVKSCPYTVPKYLPDVLMALCPHVNDKQPVQTAVKKTLQEFKRTHYDCWHEHKEQFTDDQLAVLTDLLVSPNYYV